MKPLTALLLPALLLATTAGAQPAGTANGTTTDPLPSPPCSEAWNRSVDRLLVTSDGKGHGPDIGSDEWRAALESKLGIRGTATVTPRGSDTWCRRVDQLVRARVATPPVAPVAGSGPSFSCTRVAPDSIEALVCSDAELSALDRRLADAYAGATKKAVNEQPPRLRAEQSGWVKGRNDCWKQGDRRACVRDAYQQRIVELQAGYWLVPSTGPVRFTCDGGGNNELWATYFQTDPPALLAERGTSSSLMVLKRDANGTLYQGRNESMRGDDGVLSVVWGYGKPAMRCRKAP
ncbi:lysozyme inhibitor LprI family protein [Uliginosibacterium sp. H1]|uniref:lysozyme inhibitor LprI family protein n=1 Tax=Uliginosibacterium sp. H1 TaxID=3114757 RepID=UPI002E199617|nr:lysozyme inhibitor LprI family protein [Uliginosibacterium sp. H1]